MPQQARQKPHILLEVRDNPRIGRILPALVDGGEPALDLRVNRLQVVVRECGRVRVVICGVGRGCVVAFIEVGCVDEVVGRVKEGVAELLKDKAAAVACAGRVRGRGIRVHCGGVSGPVGCNSKYCGRSDSERG